MSSQGNNEHHLNFNMICSMVVFDAESRMSGAVADWAKKARVAIAAKAGVPAYVPDAGRTIRVSPVLPHFIYSERLNYKADFIKASTAFWAALPDVRVDYKKQGIKSDHADVVLHGYNIGVVVAYILYRPPFSECTPDEVISVEMGKTEIAFSWGECKGGSVEEFAGKLFAFLFGGRETDLQSFSTYYISMNAGDLAELRAEPAAMYGIIDADWSFRKTKASVASRVVANDVSMVEGTSLYFMKERAIVFYDGEPSDYVEGITGYGPEKLAERMKDLCSRENVDTDFPDAAGIVGYAPYIDYAVELDTLRVQEALLKKYNAMLKVDCKDRREMIGIKNSVSSGMDIYYAISSATIEGVRYALESAKKEMRIDESLSLIYRKMELVADTLATKYDIENNTWNSVFAMLVAIFGFGTLIAAFVFRFLPGLLPQYSFSAVIVLTAVITIIVVVIARITIEKRTRGT